jgi:hypothetical protein
MRAAGELQMRMAHTSWIGQCMAMAVLSACGGGGSSAGTPGNPAPVLSCTAANIAPVLETSGARTLIQVKPSTASSCVTGFDEPSQVLRDSAAASKGLLAVFLPGTGGLPAQFPAFLQRGAVRGYHVIGLSYVNPQSIGELCNLARGDANCAGQAREEVLSGRDTSPLLAVGAADSIEGRLVALLKYLDAQRPGDGWGRFLTAQGAVAWELVSVSGNSQGAGHAGYIAKTRRVFRVGMYAGPSDWVLASNTPVNWYGAASLTPASAYYGYVHIPDTLANASGDATQVVTTWGSASHFNMAGAVVDVATLVPPYAGSQRLSTRACAGMGATNEHNCPMFRGNEAVWDVVSFP